VKRPSKEKLMYARFVVAACTILATMGVAAMPQTLDCRAALGDAAVRWEVELDASLPLAVVDGDDAPAEYASSHARVRLAVAGPSLLIGLVSGRMVVNDGAGRRLALGRCTRTRSV
jgi:hypothetical protein